jgi:hypothetical protein
LWQDIREVKEVEILRKVLFYEKAPHEMWEQ